MVPREAFHTRAKRASLHIDPSSFHGSDASASPSPRASATSQSPNTPISSARPSPSGSDLPDADEEKEKEPAWGPERSSTTKKSDGERRKRSRVTPDQLVHLEQFFAVERSPTAARRKEISDMLGMEERQTQVWFQNRRAKAKLLQNKKQEVRPRAQSAPDIPPELSKGSQSDIIALIHEDAPVTIIPCTDLSVGTWRRIASTTSKHDLVAYVCETKRILVWFVLSNNCGFKMEIPFDSVAESNFTNAGPGTALASFTLSKPPSFYVEAPTGGTYTWTQSADWTQGYQASQVLRHEIIGAAVQLAHLVQNLRERNHTADIYLHSPTYVADERQDPPMEIPRPPLEGVMPEQPYGYVKAETPRPLPLFSSGTAYVGHRPSQGSRSLSSISFPPSTYSSHIPHSTYGSSYPVFHYADSTQMSDGKVEMVGITEAFRCPLRHLTPLPCLVPRKLTMLSQCLVLSIGKALSSTTTTPARLGIWALLSSTTTYLYRRHF
ncbi:homeobox domain-containing protein [Mucidula mucida]|nr:homeobox domain-containing protein [Mucidula mucida]